MAGDEHVIRKGKIKDSLIALQFNVDSFVAQMEEELSLAQARENAGGQAIQPAPAGKPGRVQAKALPPMQKQMDMEEFSTWHKTWNEYAKIIKLEKEPRPTQVSNLKSHIPIPIPYHSCLRHQ